MKNANQIRHLLCEIFAIADNDEPKPLPGKPLACFPRIMDLVGKALALLPCETCNDTKQVRRVLGEIKGLPLRDYVGSNKPCPDCQPTEKLLGFQEILDCWSVHPIDDKDCVSCPQMYECRDFRKERNEN